MGRRNVVLRKKNPTDEEYVPGGPVFRRGIPVSIDEKAAKDLIESNPAKFRFATKKDLAESKSITEPEEGGETSSPSTAEEE